LQKGLKSDGWGIVESTKVKFRPHRMTPVIEMLYDPVRGGCKILVFECNFWNKMHLGKIGLKWF